MKISIILGSALLSFSNLYAQASDAPPMELKCEYSSGGFDSRVTSKLALKGANTKNEYGVPETVYQLDYEYTGFGIGGMPSKISRTFSELRCRFTSPNAFDCYAYGSEKKNPLNVVVSNESISALSIKVTSRKAGKNDEAFYTDILSEGTALIFHRPVGKCE